LHSVSVFNLIIMVLWLYTAIRLKHNWRFSGWGEYLLGAKSKAEVPKPVGLKSDPQMSHKSVNGSLN